MKTPQERAEELYKYSPNDSIEIPAYLKGRQEERAEWEEKTRWKEFIRNEDGFLTAEQESELYNCLPIIVKGKYGLEVFEEIENMDLDKPHYTHWKEII